MTPQFRILSNGSDLTTDYAPRLLLLEVVDSTDEQSDSLSLTLDCARDGEKLLPIPQRGDRIEVWIGYGNALVRVANAFVVDEIEIEGPPDTLSVRCSSTPFTADSFKGTKSLVTRRSASYDNTTVAEIVNAVAKRNGLQASVADEIGSLQIPHLDQTNESDTSFLLRVVRQAGGILKPQDGRIVVLAEAGGTTTSGENASITITPDVVTRWRVQHGTKLNDVKKVKVQHHDYNAAQTLSVSAELKKSATWKEATEGVE
jgi:phage protein D